MTKVGGPKENGTPTFSHTPTNGTPHPAQNRQTAKPHLNQLQKKNFLWNFGLLINRIHYICGDKQASMKYGFVKIAAATPLTAVANCKQNAQEIISII